MLPIAINIYVMLVCKMIVLNYYILTGTTGNKVLPSSVGTGDGVQGLHEA